MVAVINQLEDINDTWKDETNRINERIKQAALKNGVTVKQFNFAAFDIADMYRTKDGQICFNCMKGKRCEKHKYER